MQLPRLLALLVCLASSACGTYFMTGALEPVPRAVSEAPLYAQVRQLGQSQSQSPFPLDDDIQNGLTLDLHNRGAAELTLDLPAAALVAVPVSPGQQMVVRVLGAGDGDLPGSVSPIKPPPIRLAPDQRRTIWLAFEPWRFPPQDPPRRLYLRIPVAGAPELVVQLSDPVASPRWKRPEFNGGIGILASTRSFSSAGTSHFYPASPVNPFWWYAPGPMLLRFSAELQSIYEHAAEENILPTAHGRALWLSLDAAWCPRRWSLGAYAGGHWIVGRDGQTSYSQPRRLFGASAGILVPLSRQWPGRAAMRVGYTRLFGVTRANGATFELEVPWTFF
jgi:hypothetical protein